MPSKLKRWFEHIVLLMGVISSIITIIAFTTGIPEGSTLARFVQSYISGIVVDLPIIIRWPAQAFAWLLWLVLVVLYRIVILFGLPLIPAIPTYWLTTAWIRIRGGADELPLFIAVGIFFVAMFWLIITLNSNNGFSIRLGMG